MLIVLILDARMRPPMFFVQVDARISADVVWYLLFAAAGNNANDYQWPIGQRKYIRWEAPYFRDVSLHSLIEEGISELFINA